MKSKKYQSTNPKLVVWLPTILLASSAIWYVAWYKYLQNAFWLGIAGMSVLLAASIYAGTLSIKKRQQLHLSSALFFLNLMSLAVAMLLFLAIVVEVGVILTWPQ